MDGLSTETYTRLQEFKKSPKYSQLSPETQQRLDNLMSSQGEIMTPETMRKEQLARDLKSGRIEENVGQFAGGTIGGMFGGIPGSVIGGTLGRPLGRTMGLQRQALQRKPIQSLYNIAKEPLFSPVRQAMGLSPTQKEAFGTSTGVGALSEAIAAPLGIAGNRLTSTLGKGFVRTFIPKTVADRGLQEGFAKLLNPQYYKEKLPQGFVNRVENMFNVVSNRHGVAVENAVKHPKYKLINVNQVKEDISNSLKALGIKTLDDIDNLTGVSKNKSALIKNSIQDIFKYKTAQSPYTLWLKRRQLDKLLYGQKWSDEAVEVLNKVRYSLNNPIREAGPAIAKNFDEYNFVMQAKDALAKKTETGVIRRTTDDVYSQSIEDFIKTLMSPDKSETRKLLMAIDPKLANIMFDIGSSKVLSRQFITGSPYSTVLGKLISPKLIANMARQTQRPTVLRLKQGLGRAVPTLTSDILTQGE